MSKETTNTEKPCTIDRVVGSTWGDKFQAIITKTCESQIYLHGEWWPICEFELDCGLLKIDVMGKTDVYHMSDCEQIRMDGVEYELEDVYE